MAQESAVVAAALYLSGAGSEEEIPSFWIEELEAVRPVRINRDGLRPGLLLTEYQVASIRDYRASSGDILSLEELSLVDGFSAEWVAALGPFVSLESARKAGDADTVRTRATVLVRGTLTAVGAKAKVSGESWRAGAAFRGRDGTFHAELTGRFGRVTAGDFNLRFGQGLALWSGFSMTSLSTVDAFFQRSAGLSPVWSYTSGLGYRGLGYSYSGKHWSGTAFAALGGSFGGHLARLFRHGQAGLTAFLSGGELTLSADTRWNIRGADLAAEVALRQGSPAVKSAFRMRLGELFKLAVQGRVMPSKFSGRKNGEYGLALGGAFSLGRWVTLAGKSGFGSSVPAHRVSLTADAALLPIPGTDPRRLQVRIYGIWQWQISSLWALDARFTERYRNYENPRTDFRADVRFGSGPWLGTGRLENVFCEGYGLLGYLEGGYKTDSWSTYLRLTGFHIGHWDDRIYVYERDAAGTFSVPAYYGKGAAFSAVGSFKHRFRRLTVKANLRAACQLRAGRVPDYTLNLQIQCDL